MNCKDARQGWQRQVDGLSCDPRLLEHIAACPSCKAYCDEMETLLGVLDELRQETDAIGSRSAQPVHPESIPIGQRRWSYRIRTMIKIAAVLVFAASAWIYFNRASDAPPSGSGPIARLQETQTNTVPLGITLQGESAKQFLAVAQETGDARIQFYRLYPRLRITRNDEDG